MGKVICVVISLLCIVILERYARVGEDLTENGKKFLRLVYIFVAGVLLTAAIIG